MSGVRRILVLAALLCAAAALLLVVEAPRRPTGLEAVSGPLVLRLRRGDVTALRATVGERGFAAQRDTDGWRLDGAPAAPALVDALDALADLLVRLRAVDAFRSDDLAQFGLDAPRARLIVEGRRGRRTVVLGRFDSAGSAIYARREGDPRVFLVGAALGSALERVLYQAAQAGAVR